MSLNNIDVYLEGNKKIISVEFNKFSENDISFISENIVTLYSGRRSYYKKNTVFKKMKEFLKSKENSNQYYGAVAEFLLLLVLVNNEYKQEYCYKNLEENSLKKGFDGLYTKDDKIWIMESKSAYESNSHNYSHKKTINLGYRDMSDRLKGIKLNDPWENAANHARNAGSRDSLIKTLEKISTNYTNGVRTNMKDQNVIIGSTIYESETYLINRTVAKIKELTKHHSLKNQVTIVLNVQNENILLDLMSEVEKK